MMLVRWMRFSWDLKRLPDSVPPLDARYMIRAATKEEEPSARYVIDRSLATDGYWNDSLRLQRARFEEQLTEAFETKPLPSCLVVTHGARIIAASAILPLREVECQLISGPCVMGEYRNRGIGTALLYASLAALREAGIPEVETITKSTAPAAKFIYPKFGSTSMPWQYEAAAAAS